MLYPTTMGKMNVLTQEDTVSGWTKNGIQDLIEAFNNNNAYNRYGPFFLSLGLELICKGYLLGTRAAEYQNQPYYKGAKTVNLIAKEYGHNLRKIIAQIVKLRKNSRIETFLEQEYDDMDGKTVVSILQNAYTECRYPHAPQPSHLKYPHPRLQGKHIDVLQSSSLEQFCHDIVNEILEFNYSQFNLRFDRKWIYKKFGRKKAIVRFSNLLFDN